jgi:antitoxin HicB
MMNISKIRYTVLMDKNEDGGYTVTVPSLPGCISQGSTWDEALENIEEAITGFIETLTLLKKPVPVEVAVQLKDPVSV